MTRHVRDHFVQQAQRDGYLSRAAYKLEEICTKDKSLLTKSTFVFDIGSAPGSWTQLACEIVGAGVLDKRVVAVDLLPMKSLPVGAQFLQGDFTAREVQMNLLSLLSEADQTRAPDAKALTQLCVLSDMRSNTSGQKGLDHARQIELCENVLNFSLEAQHVCENIFGAKFRYALVVKATMGEDFDALRNQIRQVFRVLRIVKPKSSRRSSPELYIVAKSW